MNLAKPVLVAAVLALSQQAAAATGTVEPQVRKEITALVEAWIEAEVQDDRNALESILHKNFLSTFAHGTTLDRSSYIDFIIKAEVSPFSVENESIRQYGDTVVVIDVTEGGTTKYTWIAIRRDDEWKVISQTFSRINSTQTE